MSGVCFIGGIHGVGKTTFCKHLISNLKNFKHLSASEIIKKYKSSDEFTNKKVKNINANQELLIKGLKKEQESSNILLDGHFVLLDKNKNIKKINLNTYLQLNINCIIILTDSPENIRNKLDMRGDNDFDINLLKEMQTIEKEWGKETAKKLKKPLLEINLSHCNTYKECFKEVREFISVYIKD